MQLNLTDNVILFDEAHNIEDCFRESNSFKFTCSMLEDAVRNCDLGVTISTKKHACALLVRNLNAALNSLIHLINFLYRKNVCRYLEGGW